MVRLKDLMYKHAVSAPLWCSEHQLSGHNITAVVGILRPLSDSRPRLANRWTHQVATTSIMLLYYSVSWRTAILISYCASVWWDRMNSPLRGSYVLNYWHKSSFRGHKGEGPPWATVKAQRWWRILGKHPPVGTASNSPHILPSLPKSPLFSNSKRVITRVQKMLKKARAVTVFIAKHILS